MKTEKLVYLSGMGLLVAMASLVVGICIGAEVKSRSADKRRAAELSSDLQAEIRAIAHREAVSLVAEWREHQSLDEFLSELEAWEAKHADLGDDVSWWSNEARLMVTANIQEEQISLLGEANEFSLKTLKAIQPQIAELQKQIQFRANLEEVMRSMEKLRELSETSDSGLPTGMKRVPPSSGR